MPFDQKTAASVPTAGIRGFYLNPIRIKAYFGRINHRCGQKLICLIYRRVPPFLAQVRLNAGLTQRELAARIGKSQSWVFKSEAASRRIDIAEFLEWCAGYNMEPLEAVKRLINSR